MFHRLPACASLLAVLQQKIVERAKQMTEDDSADRLSQKAALQQEFEQLLNIFFTGRQQLHSTAALHCWMCVQCRRPEAQVAGRWHGGCCWQPGQSSGLGCSAVAAMLGAH